MGNGFFASPDYQLFASSLPEDILIRESIVRDPGATEPAAERVERNQAGDKARAS